MAYIDNVEHARVPGFRWVALKKLHYVDAKGRKRIWEMAERIHGDLSENIDLNFNINHNHSIQNSLSSSLLSSAAGNVQKINNEDAMNENQNQRKILNMTKPHKKANGVAIVPILKSRFDSNNANASIILVSQYRPPVGKECLELPAGLVDEGEDESNAALRELKEETGYEGDVTSVSPIVFSDPGLTNASCRYVFVTIDSELKANQKPEAIPDEGEIIQVHKVQITNLIETLDKFREEGMEVDARLYSFAWGLGYGGIDGLTSLSRRKFGYPLSWGWTLTLTAIGISLYSRLKNKN